MKKIAMVIGGDGRHTYGDDIYDTEADAIHAALADGCIEWRPEDDIFGFGDAVWLPLDELDNLGAHLSVNVR